MEKEKKNLQEVRDDFENEMIEVRQAEQERKNTYSANESKRQNRIRRRRIIIGAAFSFLACIGLLSIIMGAVRIGRSLLDNSEEKRQYNELLAPLVVYDPLPFESPDQADQRILQVSSIWAAIMNEDMTLYETNEYGQTLLPAVDVDRYFARVFGTNYKLTHGTVADRDIEFTFDEEKQAYIVPATSYPQGFTPQVAKIKTSFSEKIVTVGYISPQTSWTDSTTGTISKYVDYVFEKQDGEFYLVAVRESDMKVEASSSSSSSSSQAQ